MKKQTSGKSRIKYMEKSSLNQIIETAGLLITDCVVLFFI
jgi:hypothetical protein